MTLMGLGLCSGIAFPVADDDCVEACSSHCEEAAPCEHPGDSHDEECPPTHHHHDGCVHSVAHAWLVDASPVALANVSFELGRLDGGDELAPDGPVYVLDKPPLI